MTVIARHVRATPVRTSYDTWALIVDLISASDDRFRSQLEEAGNVAAMLIGEEHTESDPIVLRGGGPLTRLYTLHGSDAIDGTNANEQALQLEASEDWELALPATGTDYDLAAQGVASIDHVTVYESGDATLSQASADAETASRRRATVDLSVLED